MRSKEEIEELLEKNSGMPRLLLLPWCVATKDDCERADYDCGECDSIYKKSALRRLKADFQAFKGLKSK